MLTKEALLPAETLAMRVGVRDQWWLLPQSFSTLLLLRQALSLNLEPIGSASRLHRVLRGSSYLPCAGFSGWSCGSPCLCGQHLLSLPFPFHAHRVAQARLPSHTFGVLFLSPSEEVNMFPSLGLPVGFLAGRQGPGFRL